MKFGERLLAWLKARGLTQTQLADGIGVRPSTVSMWIAGGSPLQRNLDALVEYLEITLQQFYGPIPKTRGPIPKTRKAA